MEDNLNFRAGFVAVMGRPNVGKSTLINALLGQKVAAVSPRPQTTRKRQMGIYTTESVQVVFVDTPGVHKARHKLGELMNREAANTLEESDVILFVVDSSLPPDDEDRLLFDLLRGLKRRAPIILALNKQDLVGKTPATPVEAAPIETTEDEDAEDALETDAPSAALEAPSAAPEAPADDPNTAGLSRNQAAYLAGVPNAQPMQVSALLSLGLNELMAAVTAHLPQREPFFPEDQVTDLYEREIAADLIREAALVLLRDEVPHGVAVRVDQFTERGEEGAYIEATIFVERDSHKGIIIGQGGQMLKKIGSQARQQIESMSGRKVFLQLRVKVRKNWRDDEKTLRSFGY